MPKHPPGPGPEEQDEPTLETGFEEVRDERDGGGPAAPPPRRGTLSARRPSSRGPVKIAVVALLAVALLGGVLLYRSHHRRQVLAKGLARAAELARPDTYAGYRDAAQVLEPLVAIDPLEAGAWRAFSLAMLDADYRDDGAGQEAERLLVEPERAGEVPAGANLARAALALGRREAGTGVTHAGRAGGGAVALMIQGRLALLAGNPAGALEILGDAVAADPQLPAALAAQGDAARRTGKAEAARAAYTAALAASPRHPRAAYGLAKLALSGKAKADEAIPALQRIVADRQDTPRNERARAALHLAALQGRSGDRAGAQRTLDSVELSGLDRAWLERAVTEEELSRTGYHVVDRAPAALQSASDDDPYVPPPPAPPPPEPRPPTIEEQAKKIIAKKAPVKKVATKPAPARSKATPAKTAKKPAKAATRPPPKKASP
jgi:tetratricopeptide (TPR) repeat protein